MSEYHIHFMTYSFLPFFLSTDNSTSFRLKPLSSLDLIKCSAEVIGTSVGKSSVILCPNFFSKLIAVTRWTCLRHTSSTSCNNDTFTWKIPLSVVTSKVPLSSTLISLTIVSSLCQLCFVLWYLQVYQLHLEIYLRQGTYGHGLLLLIWRL